MRIAIGGASGFVGSEILRQALGSKAVTSIVAIGRRNVSAPEGYDGSKLSNIVLEDLNHYPDKDKTCLSDVDACIWYVGTWEEGTRYEIRYRGLDEVVNRGELIEATIGL